MPLDPRTPVIVGVAQRTWRGGDAPDPIEMCAEVVGAAAADAGAGDALLRRAASFGVVDIASRRWSDPAALIAARLGLAPAETLRTELGGDGPLLLLSDIAARIAAGELDAGVICGAEALATLSRVARDGGEPDWTALDAGAAPTRVLGSDRPPANAPEIAANLIAPVVMYPLFEHALWARAGGTLDEHRARLGRLWAGFSRVAAGNPHAWSPAAREAAEIATPAPDNRLVTQMYTKLLNSNIQTDQAAAVILCSAGVAAELGVPRDRWVFPRATAHACDHWFVSERQDLHSSPAIRFAGEHVLAHAGAGIDDVAVLDLYSCFPSAVQIAAAELGIDPFADARPLTVTGGLTFAGGPGNNYVTHAVAAMAQRLREEPAELGLLNAVGWYLTKHGVAAFGCAPPDRGFATANVQPRVDATPRRAVAAGVTGPATGESASVVLDRDGRPAVAAITAFLEDGRRAVAKSDAAQTLADLLGTPFTARPVTLGADGTFALAG